MPAQWTGGIIGQMHINEITAKQLAEEAGWNAKYLSQVLNGRVNPRGAEEKVTAALVRIITRKHAADASASKQEMCSIFRTIKEE